MAARVRRRKIKGREISTAQFATIAGVTAKTVQGYCLRIYNGDQKVLDELSNEYGLISIERHPSRWSMRVRDVVK